VLITGEQPCFSEDRSARLRRCLASASNSPGLRRRKVSGFCGLWRAVTFRWGQAALTDKPWGRGQKAPLTPENQAIHEASLADQAKRGQGNWQFRLTLHATRHAGDNDGLW